MSREVVRRKEKARGSRTEEGKEDAGWAGVGGNREIWRGLF